MIKRENFNNFENICPRCGSDLIEQPILSGSLLYRLFCEECGYEGNINEIIQNKVEKSQKSKNIVKKKKR